MPLWMQGAIELLMTATLSFLAVLVLLLAVWFAGGFDSRSLVGVSQLSSQIWLLIHGVPLNLDVPQRNNFAAISGTLSLIPLGLTLIPLALCFRSGRRLAQASYEGQFWIPLVSGSVVYALVSGALSVYSSTSTVSTSPLTATLVPLWVVLLGTIGGAWYESRSLARMIGVNAAEWVGRFSQYSRWTGSYLWAVTRSSCVALLAFIAGGALLFTFAIFYNWNDILAVYQLLGAGGVGDTAVTLLQLGVVPNMVVWAMAWSTGAGFSIGEGTIANLSQTSVGAMPALPVLGALPQPVEPYSYSAVLVPIAAGVIAGWWFFRAGENHLDEWFSLKIRLRWVSAPLSTLCLAILVALPAGVLVCFIGWFAHGSLGLGRFTQVGPTPWFFAIMASAWIAVGVILGSVLAPLLEPDNSQELERFADTVAETCQKNRSHAKRGSKKANSPSLQLAGRKPVALVENDNVSTDSPDLPKEQKTKKNLTPAIKLDAVAKQTDLEQKNLEVKENQQRDSESDRVKKAEKEEPQPAHRPVIRRPKSRQRKRSEQTRNEP